MKTSLNSRQVREGLEHGKRYAHNGLSIVCIGGRKKKEQRFAILISKKTVKNNVARNRLRRVIRETANKTKIKCDEFIIIHTNRERCEDGVCEDLIRVTKKMP